MPLPPRERRAPVERLNERVDELERRQLVLVRVAPHNEKERRVSSRAPRVSAEQTCARRAEWGRHLRYAIL